MAPPRECPTCKLLRSLATHYQSSPDLRHDGCGTLCADQILDFGKDGGGGSAMRVSESAMDQDIAWGSRE